MKNIILSLSLCLVFCAAACGPRVKHVTALPPNVTEKQAQDWDVAVANLHKIATTVSSVRQGVIAARNAGAFTDDAAYAAALQSIGKLDNLEKQASDMLRQTPKVFSASTKTFVAGLTQQIIATITQLNTSGLTGIKNAKSLDTINGFISEIGAAANLVLSLTQP